MKITHVCLGCFYIDNYTYQENMIPKYHKLMGYNVSIIASTLSFDADGNSCQVLAKSYINEHDIPVTRIRYFSKFPRKLSKFFRKYDGLLETLTKEDPDILFIHGLQFIDISNIIKYLKKNPNVKVYVDNHADFSNSARNWFSKNILHKIIWKKCAQKLQPFVSKFYGVLPARVDFLLDIYELPKEKVELLVMGADDQLVEKSNSLVNLEQTRSEYGIDKAAFVIITGGKIDSSKKQVLLLMKAVSSLMNCNLKLVIFGSVVPELREEFDRLCSCDSIRYIGWLDPSDTYKLLAVADLAIYPGRHSVLWEQTAGLGIPMVVKRWRGTDHIDLGGNVIFLEEDSISEISNVILDLISNKNLYDSMKKVALREGMKKFSYYDIAKRAIER